MPDPMAVAAATLTEARGWAVDRHVDYDGHVMIVATHDGTDQTFALSGAVGHVELTWVIDDRAVPCGTFAHTEAALDALLRVAARRQA